MQKNQMVGATGIEPVTPTMSTDGPTAIPLIQYGLDLPNTVHVPPAFTPKCAKPAPNAKLRWKRPRYYETTGRLPPPKPTTPCKEWRGRKSALGYGIWDERPAHVVAWQVRHGPIPAGLKVCHSCDNRACYEETHLWLGTQWDNMLDMKLKGRDNRGHGGRPFRFPPEIIAKAVEEANSKRRYLPDIAAELGVNISTLNRWRQLAKERGCSGSSSA